MLPVICCGHDAIMFVRHLHSLVVLSMHITESLDTRQTEDDDHVVIWE